jgi:glutamate-1-semialdehyde 2,1-aminomutase
MNLKQSESYFEEAVQFMPGGVNSPVRSYPGMGVVPPVLVRGEGPWVYDLDQNRYLDFVLSWGPLILGHTPNSVVKAIQEQAGLGTSFGAPTPGELELTRLIHEIFPCMEMSRLVSSGTEATMSALRLARGVTNRKKIIKFDGCYHGHGDSLLVQAGSGALTHGEPNSPGVLKELAEHTLIASFNDLKSVESLFHSFPEDIAALIVEPVPGNMGLILPDPGFLEGLRKLCTNFGTILIFDEVMSGFRVGFGGAVEKFGIKPDLVCLGKVLGGGMPLAAYGGGRDLMRHLSPTGTVYQAGTLSGNPLAVQAGLATLKDLKQFSYNKFEEISETLVKEMKDIASSHRIDLEANSCGSMFCAFFTKGEVRNREDVSACDMDRFKKYFVGMLSEGIYLAPSQFEACFLSTEHTRSLVDDFLKRFDSVCKTLV